MRPIRSRLSWVLSFWLICQLVALAAPAVLLAAGVAPVEELCTCPGGDHDSCPMHHGLSPQSTDPNATSTSPTTSSASAVASTGRSADSGTKICTMTDCSVPADVALLSMAGGTGVMPSGTAMALPQHTGPVVDSARSAIERTSPLDAPPPRS